MEIKHLNKIMAFGLAFLILLLPTLGESGSKYSPSLSGISSFGYPASETQTEELSSNSSIQTSVEKNGEEALTLDLRGIELSELFKVLSKKLGKNIIPSKNVTGRVNLFLNDIKYEDILEIIMISQNLAYEKKGSNVIIIMTASEYESLYGKKFDEKREIETLKLSHAQPKTIFTALSSLKSSIGEIIVDETTGTIILIDVPEKLKIMKKAFYDLDNPPITEAFELQYAKVVEIEDDIQALATEGSSSVLIDERTNTIIVTDLPGNMNIIRRALTSLDQETRQVFIEAEIIQITLTDDFAHGIEWEKVLNDPSLWGSLLTGSFTSPVTALSSAYQRITLGTLEEHNFTATLNFLKTIGDVKILSEPRISCINNEEASIHVGQKEVAISGTTSQSGESTISSDSFEYIDIGTKLTIVPTINRDGFITMKIKPEISTLVRYVTTGNDEDTRSQIPLVSTAEAETTVKVKDGSMIMIAGLRTNDSRTSVNGIPYLQDIPIVGALFSNRDSQKGQNEIIIFITPHIITGENQRSWDIQNLKRLPKYTWPENKGYVEPKFKSNSLRRTE